MQLEDHITQNALVQYLEPYTNANLSRMLETFAQDPNGDRTALVAKLAELIRADRLHAKLDLVTMVCLIRILQLVLALAEPPLPGCRLCKLFRRTHVKLSTRMHSPWALVFKTPLARLCCICNCKRQAWF
jgi:hypothetical protein